ncbi:MAG: tetratricopeptide repeat protein, partial [Candidatus Fonsibacter sp.]
DSLSHYDRAIKLKPDFAEAWNNKGLIFHNLNRYNEALSRYDRTIQLKPDFAETWYNKGNTLKDLNRYDDSLSHYDRAIQLKPDFAEAWNNKGNAFYALGRFDEALVSYERCFELNPNTPFILGNLIRNQMTICNWTNLNHRLQVLKDKLTCGSKASPPFTILGLFDSPKLQKQCADVYAEDKFYFANQLGTIAKKAKRKKVRIAYFSMDFRNHPVSYLITELFELHNRDKFEVYGFSFGINTQDPVRQRIEKAFDKFLDVRHLSNLDIVRLSRQNEIDIAIDLGGHTEGSRPEIFSAKVAPIQINYLGFPGTMGSLHLDYLIADPTLIPEDTKDKYSEKIIYLPNSYQVNDSKRKISDRKFTRQEFGLTENGFIFCCFNNNWKILPKMFDRWMRILRSVDGSVLWLYENNPAVAKNLRKEAINRNVNPDRLVFAKNMPHAEHLARYKFADLFLDTFPYGAHTTASEAIWVGTPIITLQGRSFAARVCSSLLTNIDTPELITYSEEEYCSLAIELALNPKKLAKIKTKLFKNQKTTTLFDTKLFSKHIEAAYKAVYERYHAGLPPDHIHVEP